MSYMRVSCWSCVNAASHTRPIMQLQKRADRRGLAGISCVQLSCQPAGDCRLDHSFKGTYHRQMGPSHAGWCCRFAQNKELMRAADSHRVILQYNRVARALVEYEVLWTASWLRSVHRANSGLDNTLIYRDPDTGAWLRPVIHLVQLSLAPGHTPPGCVCYKACRDMIAWKISKTVAHARKVAGMHARIIQFDSAYLQCAGKHHVNLERSLLELIRETRWLGRMGVDIPKAAQLLLPQEAKFRDYFDRLTELLLVNINSAHLSLCQA